MRYRSAIFVLTCLTLTSLGQTQSLATEGGSNVDVPFELNRQFGSILVRVHVNGKPAVLLVDTGSSHTLLSADILRVNPLFLERAAAPVKGSGLIGIAGWTTATIDLGTISWSNRKVLVMNEFREISKSMKQRVDGILGEDVLNEFTSVAIDFKNRRLVLHR
jgi:predicted aspartyl protease